MNYDLERIWNKVIVISWNWSGWAKENYKNPQTELPDSRPRFEPRMSDKYQSSYL